MAGRVTWKADGDPNDRRTGLSEEGDDKYYGLKETKFIDRNPAGRVPVNLRFIHLRV